MLTPEPALARQVRYLAGVRKYGTARQRGARRFNGRFRVYTEFFSTELFDALVCLIALAIGLAIAYVNR
jgi:hypothetical protein